MTEQFATDWIAAWNAHDLEKIMAHYADDILFTSPFINRLTGRNDGTITDRDTLQQYFELALDKYPNLNFELISVLTGLNSVVLYYQSVEGLGSAEYMEFNKAGKVSRVVAHYTRD